jgi:hypothetical protein
MSDELNLDLVESVPVTLGGKNYVITQQSRPQIERILRIVNSEVAEAPVAAAAEGEKEATLTDILFRNFDAALPAFAMILGYEDLSSPAGEEMLVHLKQHLRPAGAIKVFNRWYEVNDIRSFFLRGGRLLLLPEIVKAIEAKEDQLTEPI